MKAIYKITVTNWERHNKGMKAGHKKTLIANNFCEDAKLKAVPVTVRWMFLGILLTCGDHTRDTVEISESSLRDLLESSWSVPRAMSALQELQLLAFEKIEPFRIEKNRKENKRIEKNIATESKGRQPPVQKIKVISSNTENNRIVWEAYKDAYRARYGVDPVRNKSVNIAIANIVKRLGLDDSIEVVKFYLTHTDGFYLKATHSINLCLRDCESLRTQWARGRAITSRDVRSFEKTSGIVELMQDAKKGGF